MFPHLALGRNMEKASERAINGKGVFGLTSVAMVLRLHSVLMAMGLWFIGRESRGFVDYTTVSRAAQTFVARRWFGYGAQTKATAWYRNIMGFRPGICLRIKTSNENSFGRRSRRRRRRRRSRRSLRLSQDRILAQAGIWPLVKMCKAVDIV